MLQYFQPHLEFESLFRQRKDRGKSFPSTFFGSCQSAQHEKHCFARSGATFSPQKGHKPDPATSSARSTGSLAAALGFRFAMLPPRAAELVVKQTGAGPFTATAGLLIAAPIHLFRIGIFGGRLPGQGRGPHPELLGAL